MIKSSFANHQAKIKEYISSDEKNDKIKILKWADPKTSTYSIKYIIDNNVLFVSGDLGFAVYRWTSCVDFEWLADLSIDYFCSKCEASEKGHKYFEWENFRTSRGMSEIENKEGWIEWCCEEGEEVFQTTDYWEWAYDIGDVIHIRCHYHLIGLKMAMEQLKKRDENVEKN